MRSLLCLWRCRSWRELVGRGWWGQRVRVRSLQIQMRQNLFHVVIGRNVPNSSTLFPARTESPKESDHAESSTAPCHEINPVVPWERGSLERNGTNLNSLMLLILKHNFCFDVNSINLGQLGVNSVSFSISDHFSGAFSGHFSGHF